jgi:phosphoribosylformylglycinamidine synthase
LIDDEKHITTQWFKNAGDAIILVGTVAEVGDPGRDGADHVSKAAVNDLSYLGASQFLKVCHGKKIGPPPHVDLAHEINIQNAVRALIREGLAKSAHDCSEGGVAVALAECCFTPDNLLGANVDLKNCRGSRAGCAGDTPATTEEVLFNESQSRIVISVAPENLEKTMSILCERGIPFQKLGEVGGEELQIRTNDEDLRWPIADLYDDWWNAIRRAVESDSSAERIPSL